MGKLPLGASGGLQKGLGLQAIALKLLGHGHQIHQKLRPLEHGGIEFDLGAHLLGGAGHVKEPPALVEICPRRAAAGRRHPVGKPLEAQDLGIAAHAAAAHLQQNPLGLVGKLLRHQENLSHLPGFHGLGQVLMEPPGERRAIRASKQCEHDIPPFVVFLIIPPGGRSHKIELGFGAGGGMWACRPTDL